MHGFAEDTFQRFNALFKCGTGGRPGSSKCPSSSSSCANTRRRCRRVDRARKKREASEPRDKDGVVGLVSIESAYFGYSPSHRSDSQHLKKKPGEANHRLLEVTHQHNAARNKNAEQAVPKILSLGKPMWDSTESWKVHEAVRLVCDA